MQPIISVRDVSKTYASGHVALRTVNLDIHDGEIFALLGPNGAGKTTLISIICGIINPSVRQHFTWPRLDIARDYRAVRADDRPRAPGAFDRNVRDRLGDGVASAVACSESRETRRWSRRCCATSPSGTRRTAASWRSRAA